MDLKPRYASECSGRSANLGWVIGKRCELIARDGSRFGEFRAGELHSITGVAGESDGYTFDLADRFFWQFPRHHAHFTRVNSACVKSACVKSARAHFAQARFARPSGRRARRVTSQLYLPERVVKPRSPSPRFAKLRPQISQGHRALSAGDASS